MNNKNSFFCLLNYFTDRYIIIVKTCYINTIWSRSINVTNSIYELSLLYKNHAIKSFYYKLMIIKRHKFLITPKYKTNDAIFFFFGATYEFLFPNLKLHNLNNYSTSNSKKKKKKGKNFITKNSINDCIGGETTFRKFQSESVRDRRRDY